MTEARDALAVALADSLASVRGSWTPRNGPVKDPVKAAAGRASAEARWGSTGPGQKAADRVLARLSADGWVLVNKNAPCECGHCYVGEGR